ncbi:MAG TPA: PhnD/SsuA/transferrin family substrate-binding protein [Candidatus Sumerlaeota bacterium]|nr:PhnD/SsuA/transferrin family substrate-binding protein [Candidatus Sumerlaeota bacterium]
MKLRHIIIIMFALLAEYAFSADLPTTATISSRRAFRIGFIPSGEEPASTPGWFDGLKGYLLENSDVVESMGKEGYSDIVILPADGHRDMLQRLDVGEFDMAFCSSVIFVIQRGDYVPMLQFRGDIYDPRGHGMTLQKGVIFAGPASPLFKDENPSDADIRNALLSAPFAFVSAYNSTGYICPRLLLWRKFDIRQPGEIIFCGSPDEVVKYVVSGLADAGACDAVALQSVLGNLPEYVMRDNLVRTIMETAPVPTNPVVVRAALNPRRSHLGRVLKSSLKTYYNSSGAPGSSRLADGREENFRVLKEEIAAFEKLIETDSLPRLRLMPPPPGTFY